MTSSTRPSRTIRGKQVSVSLAAFALLAAACGSGNSQEASAGIETTTSEVAATTEAPTTTAATPTTEAEPVPVEPGFDDVTSAIELFVTNNGLNGAGFIVVDRDSGALYEEYFGEFDADRVSMIASASKMISAGVLLRAQDDGLLDIDSPIAGFADWAAGNPDITTAQLLSNSSGLVPGNNEQPYPCQTEAETDLVSCGEAIMSTDADDATVALPDTEFRYGGGQWQVSGAVAETAFGATWDDLINDIYIEPCGVSSLGYASAGNFEGDVFSYPTWFDGDRANVNASLNPMIEGGAYINVADYGTLLSMHLNGGMCGDQQVLSQASLDLMHTDRIGDVYDGDAWDPGLGYGLGWWTQRATGQVFISGTWGAFAWLDLDDGYAAYLIVENNEPSLAFVGGTLNPLVHQVVTGDSLG